MKNSKKKLITVIVMITLISTLIGGCDFVASISDTLNDIKGSLVGNKYTITGYDNYGEKNIEVHGDKIDIDGNVVEEPIIDSDGSVSTHYTLASTITITIDGHEFENCGDTMIFAGEGLEPIVDFTLAERIDSVGDGVTSLTSIGRMVNKYKNFFGKKRIVVIKSQMGVPICAFEGDDVYWKIPNDLPKMTKLMIDNKPLYIHRANYQIFDTELLE